MNRQKIKCAAAIVIIARIPQRINKFMTNTSTN